MNTIKSVLILLHITTGATWDSSLIQSDIYWTPTQIEHLKKQGHNVDGLSGQVSEITFLSIAIFLSVNNVDTH